MKPVIKIISVFTLALFVSGGAQANSPGFSGPVSTFLMSRLSGDETHMVTTYLIKGTPYQGLFRISKLLVVEASADVTPRALSSGEGNLTIKLLNEVDNFRLRGTKKKGDTTEPRDVGPHHLNITEVEDPLANWFKSLPDRYNIKPTYGGGDQEAKLEVLLASGIFKAVEIEIENIGAESLPIQVAVTITTPLPNTHEYEEDKELAFIDTAVLLHLANSWVLPNQSGPLISYVEKDFRTTFDRFFYDSIRVWGYTKHPLKNKRRKAVANVLPTIEVLALYPNSPHGIRGPGHREMVYKPMAFMEEDYVKDTRRLDDLKASGGTIIFDPTDR